MRKKILFCGGLGAGGSERQMVSIAIELSKSGNEIHYVCTHNEPNFFETQLYGANVKLIKIQVPNLILKLKLTTFFLEHALYKIIKNEGYNAVITFLGLWNYLNCKISKRLKKSYKAITGLRNNRAEAMTSRMHRLYTKYEKYSYCKVSNSENAKATFLHFYPHLTDKLCTIYNFVNIPQLTSTYSIRSGGILHIIVPASYRNIKNANGLLNALQLLDNNHLGKIRIDWYGAINNHTKAYYNEIKQLIVKYGLTKVMYLHDATIDIANRMNEADIVALFSKSEGLPNAICEGMMMGKPIIMTRVSDYSVMVDESNGRLCDSDNPLTIKRALEAFVNLNNSQIEKMGENSKNKSYKLFAKENIINQWSELISK